MKKAQSQRRNVIVIGGTSGASARPTIQLQAQKSGASASSR